MAALPEIPRDVGASSPVLVLRFSQEAWLEAHDQQGERLAYGLMSADSEQRLPVSAGLVVRLGNPDAVSAEMDGEVFDLSAYAHEDMAEFVIQATH